MGKKGKVGKQRKDKYYYLAKETGFRSRAAFKLIQLNRKFEFLQKSKVLIDLCAAPGGWLQVAQKYMPVSSIIVGVDLVPIKPIYNVITLQEDITTQKCRSMLSKELKTWKVDVVLNDGAPNVGKSWIHDAFEQNRLTLSALHLACDFLIKGGYFVTKIFRSKDYNALMWVFKKLFKRVHATKPQASRNESAEIFVVCQYYLAPDKIDSKFFDPTYVFADVKEKEQRVTKSDLLKPVTKIKKAKAEGYEDGKLLLHSKVNASQFVQSSDYLDLLSKANEIVIDNDFIKSHSGTTTEIVECLKDLKVLGRKELALIINWRQKLRSDVKNIQQEYNNEETEMSLDNVEEVEPIPDVVEDTEEKSEEARKLKQKKRKIAKEKKKLSERIELKMVLNNDQLVQEEQDLFNLKKIKRFSEFNSMQDFNVEENESNNDLENGPKRKKILIDKDKKGYFDPDESDLSDDEPEIENEIKNENGIFEIDSDDEDNELLVDFESKDDKRNLMTKMFFDNKIFGETLDDCEIDDDDENIELQELENRISSKTKQLPQNYSISNESECESDDESIEKFDLDHEEETSSTVSKEMLSHEEMALGSMLVKSKKNKNDLFNNGWNRYMHEDDEFIPSWFRKEEQIHYRKPIPVSNEMVKEYNEKMKEINSQPIKKVLEAKARKKKRALRRLEKARIKAENVTDDADMSNKEKAQYIRSIYKKAVRKVDKKPQLVVAKKQYGNRRPPGVKGRYKVVDPRLKKDKRKQQSQQQKRKSGAKKKAHKTHK